MQLSRLPGLRRAPSLLARVDPQAVLFESWHGAYSDNPRAVSETLRRIDPGRRQVWVIAGEEPELPAGTETVRPGSREYLAMLGSAGHVVTNSNMPGYFHKKPATTYVQTWHGTPLKRIAFDIENPSFAGAAKYLRHLSEDVPSWDYLVSPNRFSTEIFRRAFRYAGEIAETGYPRNDVLSSPDRDALRARMRERLEIPDGMRAVLYAPTWRDDETAASGIDIPGLADRLGPDSVLLLRAHMLVAASVASVDHPRIRNVSGVGDIRDLYLAADVLVTDYSSVMFDFAVTRKPIVFLTYDLDRYRDVLRGFYFDFEAEAPGPLVRTIDETARALEDLDALRAEHADAYDRFAERFCHLDDGRASERLIEIALHPPR